MMAWRRLGDKPLSEPMMVCLLTHICVIRPQWVNTLRSRQNGRRFPHDIFKYIFLNENVGISITISPTFVLNGSINNIPSLVKIMAWRRSGAKPLSEPMMVSLLTHICVTRPHWVKEKYPWCLLSTPATALLTVSSKLQFWQTFISPGSFLYILLFRVLYLEDSLTQLPCEIKIPLLYNLWQEVPALWIYSWNKNIF